VNFTAMIILALIGEAIWETTKMFWQKGKISIDRIGAVVVCLILAFGANLDMFVIIGVPLAIPYVGTFFTGLLISRGANVIHDLFEKFKNVKPTE